MPVSNEDIQHLVNKTVILVGNFDISMSRGSYCLGVVIEADNQISKYEVANKRNGVDGSLATRYLISEDIVEIYAPGEVSEEIKNLYDGYFLSVGNDHIGFWLSDILEKATVIHIEPWEYEGGRVTDPWQNGNIRSTLDEFVSNL